MPSKCSICNHEKRKQIEAAIANGDALRRIASQFNTSDASIRRHKKNCISKELAKAVKSADVKAAVAAQVNQAKEATRGFMELNAYVGEIANNMSALKQALKETQDGVVKEVGGETVIIRPDPVNTTRVVGEINKTLKLCLDLSKDLREEEDHDLKMRKEHEDEVLKIVMEEVLTDPEMAERLSKRLEALG